MTASIRAATEKDLQEILDIYNDAIVNTTAVYQYKPQTLSDRKNGSGIKKAVSSRSWSQPRMIQ